MPTKKAEKPKAYAIGVTVADILEDPESGIKINQRDSQALYGETFLGVKKGKWYVGTLETDGYEGSIHESALKKQTKTPTHVVSKPLTHIYPKPDFKTRPLMALSFMSRLTPAAGLKDGFVKAGEGWIFADHITPLSKLNSYTDPLNFALRFLGSPYLYGGRTSAGLDCSALVQLALLHCGIACPRDSDQQTGVGKPVGSDLLRRGDIVFFRGHTGFMVDHNNVLSATARTMDVRIEPFDQLTKIYNGFVTARRL